MEDLDKRIEAMDAFIKDLEEGVKALKGDFESNKEKRVEDAFANEMLERLAADVIFNSLAPVQELINKLKLNPRQVTAALTEVMLMGTIATLVKKQQHEPMIDRDLES